MVIVSNDSLIRTFWGCHKIQKIWFDIEQWLSEILRMKFNFNSSIRIFKDVLHDTVR